MRCLYEGYSGMCSILRIIYFYISIYKYDNLFYYVQYIKHIIMHYILPRPEQHRRQFCKILRRETIRNVVTMCVIHRLSFESFIVRHRHGCRLIDLFGAHFDLFSIYLIMLFTHSSCVWPLSVIDTCWSWLNF